MQPGSATVVAAGGTLTGATTVPSLKTLTVSQLEISMSSPPARARARSPPMKPEISRFAYY